MAFAPLLVATFGLLFESLETALEWKLTDFWLLFATVWRHDVRKIWQPCGRTFCPLSKHNMNSTVIFAHQTCKKSWRFGLCSRPHALRCLQCFPRQTPELAGASCPFQTPSIQCPESLIFGTQRRVLTVLAMDLNQHQVSNRRCRLTTQNSLKNILWTSLFFKHKQ